MGDRIVGDRYRLEEQVGRGGTATVWRGVDLDTGTPVAVKVLDREQAARPVALERLRREAQAVALLAHPNIVASHGLGIDGDAGFLAMELVDGTTVADLLTTDGRLSVERAVGIAEQVCAALAAAHAAGIIHRDIKPGNLIVDRAGVVKVCDFGIARLQSRDGDSALTAHSQAVGTCEYMAPEQATGEPVDARTDLYSLGCVLYAMLAGRPPLLGDTAMAVLHQHLHKTPTSVRSVRDDVPVALDHLITRLLAKDPADRPATATAVRDELAAIQRAPAPTASAPTADHHRATAVLTTETAALSRTTGRHRMPNALPHWLPRRTTAQAWLRHWWISVLSAALVLASAITVAAVVTGREPDRPPAATSPGAVPAPTAAWPEPADPTPTSTAATPTASAGSPSAGTRTPPAAPVDRLADVAATVQRLVDSGDLDSRAGRELQRTLSSIAGAVQSGRDTKAVERLRQLDERLVELRQDGKLSRAGFDALDVVAPIIAAIS